MDEALIRESVNCQRCRRPFSVKAALGAKDRLAGQVVEGKYVLRDLIGEGGFALVFRAEEVVAGNVVGAVAVKLIYPDPRIAREVQAEELTATLRMSHPSIVHGISAGVCELDDVTWLYLVMELAEESLDDIIARRPLRAQEAWEMTEQICSALAYLHKDPDRFVHRDLKPANILRLGTLWKLADFGLAYAMERGTKNQASGTERYMPPEAYEEGTISPAWDMWSFGVMLGEALIGKHPFECDRHMLFCITQLDPELPETLPVPFLEVIRGCLVKRRSMRWTAPQVLSALQQARGMRASLSAYRWELAQWLGHRNGNALRQQNARGRRS